MSGLIVMLALQYGLFQNEWTGVVDTDEPWSPGRHFIWLAKYFLLPLDLVSTFIDYMFVPALSSRSLHIVSTSNFPVLPQHTPLLYLLAQEEVRTMEHVIMCTTARLGREAATVA